MGTIEMDLPRLPPLWQGARWQLAWYDNRHSINTLGGSLRRVQACLDRRFLIVLPKHILLPPPPLHPSFPNPNCSRRMFLD
jgi:hypothetical protein